jgi:outer membrane biosynthesis protein TonB
MNFANELYGALRAAGGSVGGASPRSQAYGSSGYGDLAQGLQRLAQRVTTPATPAPAPADAAAPATAPADSVSKAAPPEPPRAQKAAPPEPPRAKKAAPPEPPRAQKAAPPEPPRKLSAPSPAPAPAPVTINISINLGGKSAVETGATGNGSSTDVPATEDSPLLKAFKDLMGALYPKPASGGSSSVDSGTAAQRLQAFLQQIAQSLGGDALAQTPEAALPAKGSLINLTA